MSEIQAKKIMEIKSNLCENLFNDIVRTCNPRAINSKSDVFDFMFRTGRYETNFTGGANDSQRTKHEQIFRMLYPDLEEQVSFGSGEGGYKEYGFKKITVDFYDLEKKVAYEIDGASHDEELQKLKDRIKELFLHIEYGIRTVRFKNEDVEEMLTKRLRSIIFSNETDDVGKILIEAGLV